MKIEINAITSAPETVTITKRLYTQLTQKADLYDEYKAKQREHGRKISELLTPEQRSARAHHAALARWNHKQETEA